MIPPKLVPPELALLQTKESQAEVGARFPAEVVERRRHRSRESESRAKSAASFCKCCCQVVGTSVSCHQSLVSPHRRRRRHRPPRRRGGFRS